MLTGIVQASWRYIATGSSILSPKRKATFGLVGATIASKPGRPDRVEVGLDERPHLLGLEVVGVVVAGREGVRAEHDPALDLGAEARSPAGQVVGQHVTVARARPNRMPS